MKSLHQEDISMLRPMGPLRMHTPEMCLPSRNIPCSCIDLSIFPNLGIRPTYVLHICYMRPIWSQKDPANRIAIRAFCNLDLQYQRPIVISVNVGLGFAKSLIPYTLCRVSLRCAKGLQTYSQQGDDNGCCARGYIQQP